MTDSCCGDPHGAPATTIEEALASDLIMELHQIPGVISVTLTYHHFEDLQGGESAPQPVAPCYN